MQVNVWNIRKDVSLDKIEVDHKDEMAVWLKISSFINMFK